MLTKNIVVYDSVPIIRRRLEEALRREGDTDAVYIVQLHSKALVLTVPV
jgi:hypothetical protein